MFGHEYLNYSQQLKNLANHIKECEAIIIGAGSGLSSAAGLTYSGERFNKYFSDFINKYHLTDMYSAGFYPYESLEEYWAYWSRHIYYNRYIDALKDTYQKLLQLVKDKDYFVLTTNVDHQFQKAGFDKKRLFYSQGDYGLWQCSKPCHQKTYDNKEIVNMINYVSEDNKINSYNEKALVTIMFEGKEYRVEKEEDYNELCNSINNKQGTYLVSCEYNADTGYVDLVKFMKSE